MGSNRNIDFDKIVRKSIRPKIIDGYAYGRLVDIELKDISVKKERSRASYEDDLIQTVFNFKFEIDTNKDKIVINHITGTNIGTQITHIKALGRGKAEEPEYNALTETCLKLGVFERSEVKDENEDLLISKLKKAMNTVSEEKPITIKCKLTQNSKNFDVISVRTIKLIEGV